MFEDRLENLLENLFCDNELVLDVEVLSRRVPLMRTFSACCSYNYTGYAG